MKKIIISALAVLVATAGVVALYFFVLKQPTSQELFVQSIEKTVRMNSSVEPYISFTVDSGDQQIAGELKGNMVADSMNGKFNLDVKTTVESIPLNMSVQAIALQKDGKARENYMLYKSMTTTDADYAESITSYFAPGIDKWVKADANTEAEKPTSFKEDGAIATFELLGIYAPISSMNDSDAKIFIAAAKKYNLYTVNKEVIKTKFRGIDARKLIVSINKDAFMEFNKEMSGSLSKDAKYKPVDDAFINDAFGAAGKMTADVYLSPDSPSIIGVELKVELQDPIVESSFDTELDKISASVLIDYNRKLTVEAPAKYISQTEYDTLLSN